VAQETEVKELAGSGNSKAAEVIRNAFDEAVDTEILGKWPYKEAQKIKNRMMSDMVNKIKINEDNMAERCKNDMAFMMSDRWDKK